MTAEDRSDDGAETVIFGRTSGEGVKTVRFGPRPEQRVRPWVPGAPKEAPPAPPEAPARRSQPDPVIPPDEEQEARREEPRAGDQGAAPADVSPGYSAEEVEAAVAAEREAVAAEAEAVLGETARAFQRGLTELTQRLHEDLVDLAVRLARRLVGRALELDPSIVEDAARHALRMAGPIRSVTIKCHPDDAETLRASAGDMAAAETGRPVEVIVRPSDDVSRGGVVLTFADGIVDARVDKALAILGEAVKAALVVPNGRATGRRDDGGPDEEDAS